MPKMHKERRRVAKEVYFNRRARYPHRQKSSLEKALSKEDKHTCFSHLFSLSGVCPQCAPVLSRYQDTFLSMVHQGSQLKCKKCINPVPKKEDPIPYRDILRHNK